VDDTTLTELLPRGSQQTYMHSFLPQLQTWATPNKMNINFTKTKETILGPLAKSPPQLLSDCSTNNPVSVERVQLFKLLGITLSQDMNCQAHIDAIITKAFSRLYFLKILKKSGLQSHQLRHFYLSVIRQILEYCSSIWHHGLTKAQAESLEAIQHSESLTHLQSACLTMSHLASPSSPLSTTAENT